MTCMRGFLTGLLTLLLSFPAAAQFDTSDIRSALEARASELWKTVPDDSRLAVRPIQPHESGLSGDIASRLDAALLRALDRTRPTAATLLARNALQSIFEEAEAFGGRDPARMLSDLSATVLALPRAIPTGTGLDLEISLVSVGGSGFGGTLATLLPLSVQFSAELAELRPPSIAARQAGMALAEALRAAHDPAQAFKAQILGAGAQGDFAEWFAAQLGEHLAERLGEPPLYRSRSLRSLGNAASNLKVRLNIDVWDLGNRVDISITARSGSKQAKTVARIPKRDIPAGFLPLTRDGGRVARGMQRARGAAQSGAGLRADELPFVAQSIARARLIDAALGGQRSVSDTARTREDFAAALRRLEAAVPYEEILRVGGSVERRTSSLSARIERVGGSQAPQVTASVDRATYSVGVPIRVRVRMESSSGFVGLFAIQADGSVARVVPALGADAVALDGGREIMLPRPQDGEIASAPMPDVSDNLEALVLLVSAIPFDPRKLAPALGETSEESLQTAVTLSAFLDQMAGLDLARATLRVLPYRISRHGS
jgi:hypothetical protein